jgi:transcription antitermination protein NusB
VSSGGIVGMRRRAREFALQMLFSMDVNGLSVATAVAHFWRDFKPELGDERLPPGEAPPADDPQVISFAETLVQGTAEHLEEIDAVIQKVSKNWRLERMARVDRNVLRLATYELWFSPEVPAKVIINEAIEVAKRFGAAESAAFVNGLLDRISQELKRS